MSTVNTTSRRRFLHNVTGTAAALGVSTGFTPTYLRAQGANDDLRIAVIGFNSKGGGHISGLIQQPGVRLVGLCDADQAVIDKWVNKLKNNSNLSPKTYTDYRKLCEDPEVDAVIIATPNHLHTVIAMTAIANGKHVYVEKPVSHNIWEGRKLVEAAAARPGIIVQHGMQRRSDGGWREAHAWLKEGHLGKILCSRGLCYKKRPSIGKVDGPQIPPKTLDYDLWSGPREIKPLMRQRFHYDWHWQFDYGNGDLGNQGPHQTDVAAWMLDNAGIPARVVSLGGRFGYKDDGNTANTQVCIYEYDDGTPPIIFEVRGLPAKDMKWGQVPAYIIGKAGTRVGNVIHCEGGYIVESKAYDNDGNEIKRFNADGGGRHQQQWIESLRAGKPVNDNLLIKHGHVAAALAHMGNISYRLGKATPQGEIEERFAQDVLGKETVDRFFEHLAANGIKPDPEHATTLGPSLSFDATSERFTGDLAETANTFLSGHYREGHQLPEIT